MVLISGDHSAWEADGRRARRNQRQNIERPGLQEEGLGFGGLQEELRHWAWCGRDGGSTSRGFTTQLWAGSHSGLGSWSGLSSFILYKRKNVLLITVTDGCLEVGLCLLFPWPHA